MNIFRRLLKVDKKVLHGGDGNYRLRCSSPVWKAILTFFDRIDTFFIFSGRKVRMGQGRVRSRAEKKIADTLRKVGVTFIYEGGPHRKSLRNPLKKMFKWLGASVAAVFILLFLFGTGVSNILAIVEFMVCVEIVLIGLKAIQLSSQKCLRLGKAELRPDFYIPSKDVYIEYWGLADTNPDYKKLMRSRQHLYHKHEKKLIDIYPRHMKDIEGFLKSELAKY